MSSDKNYINYVSNYKNIIQQIKTGTRSKTINKRCFGKN